MTRNFKFKTLKFLFVSLAFFITISTFSFAKVDHKKANWYNEDKVIKSECVGDFGTTSLTFNKVESNDRYLVFDIVHDGEIYPYNPLNLVEPGSSGGWTHMLFHADTKLDGKINYFKSYVRGPKGARRVERDFYDLASCFSTDRHTYFVRLSQVFKVGNNGKQEAKLYLALKNRQSLTDGEDYTLESRFSRKTKSNNWGNYLIEYQVMARGNGKKYFDYTDAIKFDKNGTVKINNKIKTSAPIGFKNDIYTDDKRFVVDTGTEKEKILTYKLNGQVIRDDITTFAVREVEIENKKSGEDLSFKKDDLVEVVARNKDENGQQYEDSDPVSTKVKAKITFISNGKEDTVEAPENIRDRSSKKYIPNGLEGSMPQNPKPKYLDLKFLGWSTKKVENMTTAEFLTIPELLQENQWEDVDSQEKVFRFTKNSPIDKNRKVYAVWGDAKDDLSDSGITFVLHKNKNPNDVKEEKKEHFVFFGDMAEYDRINASVSFDEQREHAAKNAPNSILPDSYNYSRLGRGGKTPLFDVDGKIFVGWSSESHNSDMEIEKLFENMAIVVKRKIRDGVFKYYLTTVEADGTDFTDKVTKKRKIVEIFPKNGKVDLYACWKPDYEIKLKQYWFDSPEDHKKSLKEWFNTIAHSKNGPENAGLKTIQKRNIQIGLLFRTAVTEAERPTVTGAANYYIVPGSLKENIKENINSDGYIVWKYPAFDEHGKRNSFVAVEVDGGDEISKEEGRKKYDSFKQVWSNVWASVEDNLAKSNRWDERNVAKTQLILTKNGTEVDAFTGATVRRWTDNGKEVDIGEGKLEIRQVPVVGTNGKYEIDLFNIKSNVQNPEIRTVIDGDDYFYMTKFSDEKVSGITLDLPEYVNEPVTFLKDGENWKPVKFNEKTKKYEDVTDVEKTYFRRIKLSNVDYDIAKGEEVKGPKTKETFPHIKVQLVQEENYKPFFKTGQHIRVKAFALLDGTPPKQLESPTTLTIVADRGRSGYVRGLVQKEMITKNGKNYIVIEGSRPTEDLGLLSDTAVTSLIVADANAAINPKGATILAEGKRIGSKYRYEVSLDDFRQKNPEEKFVTVLNQDGKKRPFVTPQAILVDIEGPLMLDGANFVSEKTLDVTEGANKDIITFNEKARIQTIRDRKDGKKLLDVNEIKYLLLQSDVKKLAGKDFSSYLNLKPKDHSGKEWILERNFPVGEYSVEFWAYDNFKNPSKITLTFNVKEKGSVDFDITRELNKDECFIFDITNKEFGGKFKAGSSVKVYDKDDKVIFETTTKEELKTIRLNVPIEKDPFSKVPFSIGITEPDGAEKKKYIASKNVSIDVTPPTGEISLETDIKDATSKKLKLWGIPSDAIYLDITVTNPNERPETIRIKRGDNSATNRWYVLDENDKKTNNFFEVKDGNLEVEFNNIIKSHAEVKIELGDVYRNSKVINFTMGSVETPRKVMDAIAELANGKVLIIGRAYAPSDVDKLKGDSHFVLLLAADKKEIARQQLALEGADRGKFAFEIESSKLSRTDFVYLINENSQRARSEELKVQVYDVSKKKSTVTWGKISTRVVEGTEDSVISIDVSATGLQNSDELVVTTKDGYVERFKNDGSGNFTGEMYVGEGLAKNGLELTLHFERGQYYVKDEEENIIIKKIKLGEKTE